MNFIRLKPQRLELTGNAIIGIILPPKPASLHRFTPFKPAITSSRLFTRTGLRQNIILTHAAEEPASLSDDEPVPQLIGVKFSFEDVVYYINIIYFVVLLASVFTGNRHFMKWSSFTNFVTAMFLASAAFTGWSATRWITDIRQHLAMKQRRKDLKALLRYGWSAIFWFGFCLWYAVPPVDQYAGTLGTLGAISCLYGIALSGSSALLVGSWSFLGPPSRPTRLVTGGPYALLRHPQSLGSFLAVIGFSLAGGAVAAASAFTLSFLLYTITTAKEEEKMLESTFGVKYKHYKERVPAFAYGLWLLLILEAFLVWRYGIRPVVPLAYSRVV